MRRRNLEHKKRESEIRRQPELPTDLTRRAISVDPIFSPFDSGDDKDLVPRDTPQPSPVSTQRGTPIPSSKHSPSRPHQIQTPTESSETPSSPLTPKCPIFHWKLVSSQDSVDSDSDFTMTISTKELVDALTKTLKNINQSPTIPLLVFKGKKGEDPEDHILKVEEYFGVHQITEQDDKIKRFKDTLYETARKWAQTLNYTIFCISNLITIQMMQMTRKPL